MYQDTFYFGDRSTEKSMVCKNGYKMIFGIPTVEFRNSKHILAIFNDNNSTSVFSSIHFSKNILKNLLFIIHFEFELNIKYYFICKRTLYRLEISNRPRRSQPDGQSYHDRISKNK